MNRPLEQLHLTYYNNIDPDEKVDICNTLCQRAADGQTACEDLPPTFYVYGTEDPFYRQFQQQYDVIRNMGISTGRIMLNGWPTALVRTAAG